MPTRDIAREAGVSQAVLFQRFPSKKELFFAAMAPASPDIPAILGATSTPAQAYLEGVAVRMLAYFEAVLPTVLQLVAHPEFGAEAMNRLHEQLLAGTLGRALSERLSEMKKAGLIGGVDPESAARLLVASMHSVVVFHAMGGHTAGESRPRVARRLIAVIWTGLAPVR